MNQTYICLLRGINVTGHNIIKMEELRKLMEKLQLDGVKTYIQSGNIVFRSDKSEDLLNEKIHTAILEQYGYDVSVQVRTLEDLERIEKGNPLKERTEELQKLHVTFLDKEPGPENIRTLEEMEFADEYMIIGREIFLFCPNGYGKTKLDNNFLARKLKVQATTRNLKTVKKLIEMAKA